MKTTIYGLLGMVKDGKIPERIKYNDYEYRYHDKEHGYCRSGYDCTYICLNSEYYLFDILNDEVEILEEEKEIPEKLEQIMSKRGKYNSIDELAEEMFKVFETIDNLIINQNKIIDFLKAKENKYE